MRRTIITLFVGFVVTSNVACPDPCLMAGNGCNSDEDCAANKHCILPKDGDALGCFLVKGTCESFAVCHRQEDCSEGQCCDEYSDRCAPDGACTQKCNMRDSNCPEGQICDDRSERCRPGCDEDNDCRELEVCDLYQFCSIPQGTSCGTRSDAIVGECGFYVRCIDPNDNGLSYCSIRCDEVDPCPSGFRCNGDDQCVAR